MCFWLCSYPVFRSHNWTRTSGTRSSQGQSYARVSTISHQETASVLPQSGRLLPKVDTIVRTHHSKIVRHEEKHNFPMVARSWTSFCCLEIVSGNETDFTITWLFASVRDVRRQFRRCHWCLSVPGVGWSGTSDVFHFKETRPTPTVIIDSREGSSRAKNSGRSISDLLRFGSSRNGIHRPQPFTVSWQDG